MFEYAPLDLCLESLAGRFTEKGYDVKTWFAARCRLIAYLKFPSLQLILSISLFVDIHIDEDHLFTFILTCLQNIQYDLEINERIYGSGRSWFQAMATCTILIFFERKRAALSLSFFSSRWSQMLVRKSCWRFTW